MFKVELSPAARRCLSVLIACLVISTAVIGGVEFADRDVSPVGESEAIVCGGLCIAGVAGVSAGVGIAAGTVAYHEFVEKPKLNDIKQTESYETKLTIHQVLHTQKQNNEVLGDSFSNFLNDSQGPATMAAKNEYIRVLNNNSGISLSQAKTEALIRNNDYYAKKEVQMFKSWESSLRAARAAEAAAQNDSGVSNTYINAGYFASYGDKIDGRYTTLNHNVTVTLANGTSYDTKAIGFEGAYDPGNGISWGEEVYYYPGHFNVQSPKNPGYDAQTMDSVQVDGHKDADPFTYVDFTKYKELDQQIEQNRVAVRNRIQNFVDTTYDGYQSGEINNTDLVDPYLAARNYSPEGNYGTFTTRSLAAMGYNGPANLSRTKTMNVSVNGTLHRGILLSDGLPSGDTFQVGTTYNASNIPGRQFVQSDGSTKEIAGEFTIESIHDMEGEPMNTSEVQYRNVTHRTTDLTAYKEQLQKYRELQQEVNQRQENLSAAQAGGGLFGNLGVSNLSGMELLALIGGAIALMLLIGRADDDTTISFEGYDDD